MVWEDGGGNPASYPMQMNHDMGDGCLSVCGAVGTAPKDQVAWLQDRQLAMFKAVHRGGVEPAAFSHQPLTDLIRLPWRLGHAGLSQEVIDGAGAVHATAFGIM